MTARQSGSRKARKRSSQGRRAKLVGEGDLSALGGVDEARDAEDRMGVQFQGIAESGIDPPHDRVHPLQAAHRAQKNLPIPRGEVGPLDERMA